MSTHVPGFLSFFSFFVSFCICQISHQKHKVNHTNVGSSYPIGDMDVFQTCDLHWIYGLPCL